MEKKYFFFSFVSLPKHEVDGGVQHQCSQGEEGEYPGVAVAADLNDFLLLGLLVLLMAVAVLGPNKMTGSPVIVVIIIIRVTLWR